MQFLNGGPASGFYGMVDEAAVMEHLRAQLFDMHEPPDRPTARRIRRLLPKLRVREGDPANEPGEGEAFACAGEPCAVCHDEFSAQTKVHELPCSHVSGYAFSLGAYLLLHALPLIGQSRFLEKRLKRSFRYLHCAVFSH